jgi:hypothetical protein
MNMTRHLLIKFNKKLGTINNYIFYKCTNISGILETWIDAHHVTRTWIKPILRHGCL